MNVFSAKAKNPWHPSAGREADLDFPWPLFLASVLMVVAGHCFFSELYEGIGHLIPWWCRALLLFTAASYAASVLHAQRLEHDFSLFGFALAGFCLFSMGVDLHRAVGQLEAPVGSGLITGILFVVGLMLAHRWRHELERGRSLRRVPARQFHEVGGRHIRALILTVSKPDVKRGHDVIILKGEKMHVRFIGDQDQIVELAGKDLSHDIAALDKLKPNWQQLLRALEPHVKGGHLEMVTLYGSKESRLEDCAAFLEAYAGKAVVRTLRPVDLEEFEPVHALLKEEVTAVRENGLGADEVAIDITGGYKIPSVVGAVFTLNQAVVCQYVQSVGSEAASKKELQPYIYDFRWDTSLELPA